MALWEVMHFVNVLSQEDIFRGKYNNIIDRDRVLVFIEIIVIPG